MSATNKIHSVFHDPFARFSLMRRVIGTRSATCQWCGQHRVIRGRQQRLFQYGNSPDDSRGRIDWERVAFCSIGCKRSYWQ